MIQITLKQFRCWENLKLNISLGQITLIKGNSGSGKTTILSAILWCLYGKIQLVTPNQLNDEKKNKQPKTQVNIELPFVLNDVPGQMIISRRKNPNQLIITHGTCSYEDKVAQSMIDDLFGTYDIWSASCYVGQNSRNTFLTAPNAGKMELLNSIAFHEEDPAIFIEKITNILAEKDVQYKTKLQQYTADIKILEDHLKESDISKALSVEQIEQHNKEIDEYCNQITLLEEMKKQRDIDSAVLNNLQEQYHQIPIIIIPEPDEQLKIMMEKFGNVDNVIPFLYQRDHLNKEINALPDYHPNDFTMANYHETAMIETIIKENQYLANSLNVPYDHNEINKIIKNYQGALDEQTYLVLQDKIATTEKEYLSQKHPLEIPSIIPQIIVAPDYSKYNCESLLSLIKEKSIELTLVSIENNNDETKILEQRLAILYQKLSEKVEPLPVIIQLEKELSTIAEQKIVLSDYCSYEQQIENLKVKLKVVENTSANEIDNTIIKPDLTVYDKRIAQEQLQRLCSEQNELKAHIQYLRLGQDILSCPNCNTSLRYHQCQLILAEGNPVTSAELNAASIKLNDYNNSITQCNKHIEDLGQQEMLAQQHYQNELQKNKQNYIAKINREIISLTTFIQTNKMNEQKELERKKQEQLSDITNKIEIIKMKEQQKIDATRQQINKEIAMINEEIKRLITLANNKRQARINDLNSIINQTNFHIQQLQTTEKLERIKYDNAVREEQNRIINTERIITQLMEEQKRRDLSVQILEKRLSEYKQQLSLLPKTDNIQTRILTGQEIEQITHYIGRLKEIKIMESPKFSSDHIKQCLYEQEIIKKKNDLIISLQEHLTQLPAIFHNQSLVVINDYHEKMKRYLALKSEMSSKKIQMDTMKDNLTRKIVELRNKIGSDDPAVKIEYYNSSIEQLKQLIREGERASMVKDFYNKMKNEEKLLTTLSVELTELQMLKQYAVDTESKSLQDVVASINTSIAEVCETLFDKDINIVLNLFKTLKSTKNVKPQVNFTISYKGGSFENINQMSGGEGDRASIALTLALNRLSSFPILMLDESLSSLDLDMKEATVETISKTIIYDQHKQQKINRAVVIIMHDGIEGIFDNVINIDDISEGRY